MKVQDNFELPEIYKDGSNECTRFLASPGSEINHSPKFRLNGLVDELREDSTSPLTPPYTSNLSFTIPLDSELLYFLSHGSFSYGDVKVNTFEDAGDDVRVDINVEYWSKAALERATICVLENREHTKSGLGVFTPRGSSRGRYENLKFAIDVQIPVAENSSPRIIKALEMHFSNFRYELGDLSDLVFQKLSVETSNGAILAEVIIPSCWLAVGEPDFYS